MVFHYLSKQLRNRVDAEEAFQETFLRIHRFLPSYDPEQKALAWVFTIARHVAIDLFKQRRAQLSFMEEEHSLDSRIEQSFEAREELKALLAHLSPSERDLLSARLLESEDFEAIASHLQTSPLNVRQKLSRLLKKLRALRSRA